MTQDDHLPATTPTVIETARLRLRAYRDDEHADLVDMAGNWEVARWLSHLPHPYSDEAGRAWIAHVRQEHATGRPRSFAIALKDTDRLIGGGGIDGDTGDGRPADALGYWLGQPHWGQGYGREAVAAVVTYGFRALGLETLQAHTDPENIASQRVLLACGLKRAGEITLVRPTRHSGATRVPLFRISRCDDPA